MTSGSRGARSPLQRLFFALWPDDAVRREIGAIAGCLPRQAGRLVARENFHITLLFLGPMDAERRACAERAADSVAGHAFVLALDQIGWWRGPRVVWIGAPVVPDALAALAGNLYAGVSGCGIALDKRPFHAHVTIARKARRAVRADPPDPVAWQVRSFSLVESVTRSDGAQYTILKTWPLS